MDSFTAHPSFSYSLNGRGQDVNPTWVGVDLNGESVPRCYEPAHEYYYGNEKVSQLDHRYAELLVRRQDNTLPSMEGQENPLRPLRERGLNPNGSRKNHTYELLSISRVEIPVH